MKMLAKLGLLSAFAAVAGSGCQKTDTAQPDALLPGYHHFDIDVAAMRVKLSSGLANSSSTYALYDFKNNTVTTRKDGSAVESRDLSDPALSSELKNLKMYAEGMLCGERDESINSAHKSVSYAPGCSSGDPAKRTVGP